MEETVDGHLLSNVMLSTMFDGSFYPKNLNKEYHGCTIQYIGLVIKILTAPDRCYYLNQAYLSMFIAGLKRGKTNRSQTATDVAMVIK